MTLIFCPQCKTSVEKAAGVVNRARAIGSPIYCGRVCAGLARRQPPKSDEQKRREKASYDTEYRLKNKAILKAKKAAAYKANPNRERERTYRQANMHRHVEYCRRPDYRQKKVLYDQQRRAKIFYGPFAQSFLTLLELENEIASRASRNEIYRQNGTQCKSVKRKREYDKAIGG